MIDANTLEQEVDRVYGLFTKYMDCQPKNPDHIRQMILIGVLFWGIGAYTEEIVRDTTARYLASQRN